jgi:hypothetical protein
VPNHTKFSTFSFVALASLAAATGRFSHRREYPKHCRPALAKGKPVFIKVEQIQTGIRGHTLMVKVVSLYPVKVTSKNGG